MLHVLIWKPKLRFILRLSHVVSVLFILVCMLGYPTQIPKGTTIRRSRQTAVRPTTPELVYGPSLKGMVIWGTGVCK